MAIFYEEFNFFPGGVNFEKSRLKSISINTERKSKNFCVKSSIFFIFTASKMSDSEEGYSDNEEASIKARLF